MFNQMRLSNTSICFVRIQLEKTVTLFQKRTLTLPSLFPHPQKSTNRIQERNFPKQNSCWTRSQGNISPILPIVRNMSKKAEAPLATPIEKEVEVKLQSKEASPGPVAAAGDNKKLSSGQRLKLAIRDYGGTVLVFHITMSLCSLGFFYALVSSGLDVVELLRWIGLGEDILQSKITTGGSTFVLAYAIHKVFAPIRLGITLTAVPFIVKKLRAAGFLKRPPPTPPVQ